MKALMPLLAAVALWASLVADVAAQGSAATDRAALEAFYAAVGGSSWTNRRNWRTSAPLGEWHGVTTDLNGRVTRLVLFGNGLTGPIPAALGDLALLQTLDLGRRWDSTAAKWVNNALTGSIPPALERLANLRRLDLSGNDLTGPHPGRHWDAWRTSERAGPQRERLDRSPHPRLDTREHWRTSRGCTSAGTT